MPHLLLNLNLIEPIHNLNVHLLLLDPLVYLKNIDILIKLYSNFCHMLELSPYPSYWSSPASPSNSPPSQSHSSPACPTKSPPQSRSQSSPLPSAAGRRALPGPWPSQPPCRRRTSSAQSFSEQKKVFSCITLFHC